MGDGFISEYLTSSYTTAGRTWSWLSCSTTSFWIRHSVARGASHSSSSWLITPSSAWFWSSGMGSPIRTSMMIWSHKSTLCCHRCTSKPKIQDCSAIKGIFYGQLQELASPAPSTTSFGHSMPMIFSSTRMASRGIIRASNCVKVCPFRSWSLQLRWWTCTHILGWLAWCLSLEPPLPFLWCSWSLKILWPFRGLMIIGVRFRTTWILNSGRFWYWFLELRYLLKLLLICCIICNIPRRHNYSYRKEKANKM